MSDAPISLRILYNLMPSFSICLMLSPAALGWAENDPLQQVEQFPLPQGTVAVTVTGTYAIPPAPKENHSFLEDSTKEQIEHLKKLGTTEEQFQENKASAEHSLRKMKYGSTTSVTGTLEVPLDGYKWTTAFGDAPDLLRISIATPEWEDNGLSRPGHGISVERTVHRGGFAMWQELPFYLNLNKCRGLYASMSAKQLDTSVTVTLTGRKSSDISVFPHAAGLEYVYDLRTSRRFPVTIKSLDAGGKPASNFTQFWLSTSNPSENLFPDMCRIETGGGPTAILHFTSKLLLPPRSSTEFLSWGPNDLVEDRRFDFANSFNYKFDPKDTDSSIAARAKLHYEM